MTTTNNSNTPPHTLNTNVVDLVERTFLGERLSIASVCTSGASICTFGASVRTFGASVRTFGASVCTVEASGGSAESKNKY